MKFLVTLALGLILCAGVEARIFNAGPAGSSYAKADGTLKVPEQDFIKVKNGSGSTLANGRVVVSDLTADDGITVTTSSTANRRAVCVIAQTSCASGAMCKCQVYGYHSAVQFDKTNDNGTATAGEQGYLSENYAGYVEAKPVSGTNSIDAYDRPIGTFLDSPSASGDAEMFLHL